MISDKSNSRCNFLKIAGGASLGVTGVVAIASDSTIEIQGQENASDLTQCFTMLLTNLTESNALLMTFFQYKRACGTHPASSFVFFQAA